MVDDSSGGLCRWRSMEMDNGGCGEDHADNHTQIDGLPDMKQ